MKQLELIKMILEELENQSTELRATRGYGIGHPIWAKGLKKQLLGDQPYADNEDEEEAEYEIKKVAVSKAFKKIEAYD